MHADAPLRGSFAPRQGVQAQFAHGPAQRLGGERGIDAAGGPGRNHDAIEALDALADQRAFAGIPTQLVAFAEMRVEVFAQPRLVHRCGTQQQRILRLVAQFAGDQPGLADERAVIEQPRHPPVAQLVAQAIAAMAIGDAVREGVRQQIAERMRGRVARRRGIHAQPAAPLLRGGIDGGERRAVGIVIDAAFAERGKRLPALRECITARAQRIACFDQRGEIAGECASGIVACGQQHRRESRMRAEHQHAATGGGDRAFGIQRIEPLQQVTRGGEGTRWRRIDKPQRIAAPGREFQCQPSQLDLRDFRATLRRKPLGFRPQAIRPAFRHATGTTRSLVGRGLRDADGIQPRKAGVGVEARFAREAGIDHHAHAGQGDAGLGDIGGEHDAAAAIGGGLQHARLLLDRQVAVEGEDLDGAACR